MNACKQQGGIQIRIFMPERTCQNCFSKTNMKAREYINNKVETNIVKVETYIVKPIYNNNTHTYEKKKVNFL